MMLTIPRDSSEEQQQHVMDMKLDASSSMKRSFSGVDPSFAVCKPKRKISMLRARSSESVCTDARVIPGQPVTSLFNKSQYLEIKIVETNKTDTTAVATTQYSPFDLLVIGEHGSGATALASRFMGQRLSPGLRCVAKCGQRYVTATVQVFRHLNDVPAADLAKYSGIVFVASDREALLRSAKQRAAAALPCILIASKQDQHAAEKLNQVDLDEIARGFHAAFLTSALTGNNVEEAFACLLLEASLLRQQRNKARRSKNTACVIS